eukprot:scaffold34424_cov75-Phaeocystis_antarctica.AAC.3
MARCTRRPTTQPFACPTTRRSSRARRAIPSSPSGTGACSATLRRRAPATLCATCRSSSCCSTCSPSTTSGRRAWRAVRARGARPPPPCRHSHRHRRRHHTHHIVRPPAHFPALRDRRGRAANARVDLRLSRPPRAAGGRPLPLGPLHVPRPSRRVCQGALVRRAREGEGDPRERRAVQVQHRLLPRAREAARLLRPPLHGHDAHARLAGRRRPGGNDDAGVARGAPPRVPARQKGHRWGDAAVVLCVCWPSRLGLATTLDGRREAEGGPPATFEAFALFYILYSTHAASASRRCATGGCSGHTRPLGVLGVSAQARVDAARRTHVKYTHGIS